MLSPRHDDCGPDSRGSIGRARGQLPWRPLWRPSRHRRWQGTHKTTRRAEDTRAFHTVRPHARRDERADDTWSGRATTTDNRWSTRARTRRNGTENRTARHPTWRRSLTVAGMVGLQQGPLPQSEGLDPLEAPGHGLRRVLHGHPSEDGQQHVAEAVRD